MNRARTTPLLLVAVAIVSCSNPRATPVEKAREPAVSDHPDAANVDGSVLTADEEEAAGILPGVKDCVQPTDLVWRPSNPDSASKARADMDRRLGQEVTSDLTPDPDDEVKVHLSCPADMNNDGRNETIVRLCFNPDDPDDCPSEESSHYVEIAIYTESEEGLKLIGVPHRAEELSGVQHPRFIGLAEHQGEVTLEFETNYSELPDRSATDCRDSWMLGVRDDELKTVRDIRWCAFDNSVLHEGSQMLEVRQFKDRWTVERVSEIEGLKFGDVIEGVADGDGSTGPENVDELLEQLHGASIGSSKPVTLKVNRDGEQMMVRVGE